MMLCAGGRARHAYNKSKAGMKPAQGLGSQLAAP